MAEITVRVIDKAHKEDINIKNEPFELFGRMVVSYNDGWSYTCDRFDCTSKMCFPDENYDYEAMAADCFFVGAYDGERCIGLAILQKQWHKYLYLYDLKVNRDYRSRGVGSKLIEESVRIALKNSYRGLYTIAQDNNLAACRFYIKCGFSIGGLDTRVYTGTSQEGKKDIIFYFDA